MLYNSKIKVENEFDLIQKVAQIYCLTDVPEHMELTYSELNFFVHCVMLYNTGYDISSRKTVRKLEELTGYTKKSKRVYTYRKKLKDLGWLYQTKEGLRIPDQFINIKEKTEVFFNINITINET